MASLKAEGPENIGYLDVVWRIAKAETANVQGAARLTQHLIEDDRGWFSRVFERREGSTFDFGAICDVNNSFSTYAGTFRGLHWQTSPYAEAKVVRCVRGQVLDVIVDTRIGSITFGQTSLFRLSGDVPAVVYVPRGCAHGYLSLRDRSEVIYWSDALYMPEAEEGMRYDDPFIDLPLPMPVAHVSAKDMSWPDFPRAAQSRSLVQRQPR